VCVCVIKRAREKIVSATTERFSKVNAALIVYSKRSSTLDFENFYTCAASSCTPASVCGFAANFERTALECYCDSNGT